MSRKQDQSATAEAKNNDKTTKALPYEDVEMSLGELLMRSEGDTLLVSGDIDLYQAPPFRETAEAHIASVENPRFDLSDVAFIDSAGLATLLYLARQAAGQDKSLRIRVLGGPRRVLKITGIDRVLKIED